MSCLVAAADTDGLLETITSPQWDESPSETQLPLFQEGI